MSWEVSTGNACEGAVAVANDTKCEQIWVLTSPLCALQVMWFIKPVFLMWASLWESQTIIRAWARKIEPLYVSEGWRIYIKRTRMPIIGRGKKWRSHKSPPYNHNLSVTHLLEESVLEAHREVFYLQTNGSSHWFSLPENKGIVLWSWLRSYCESLLSVQHLTENFLQRLINAASCSLLNQVRMSLLQEHSEEAQKKGNSKNMKPAWFLCFVKWSVI